MGVSLETIDHELEENGRGDVTLTLARPCRAFGWFGETSEARKSHSLRPTVPFVKAGWKWNKEPLMPS